MSSRVARMVVAPLAAVLMSFPGAAGATGAPAAPVVTNLAAGANHTCAVTSTGAAMCWGWNYYGQLGNNSTADRHTPVGVSSLASGVATMAAGDIHTCALLVAGAVKCWGDNTSSQLGDGSTAASSTPVGVVGLSSTVTAIAAGGDYTCALSNSGGVRCWGSNFDGQLGNGSTADSGTPVDVSGLASGVTAIAAGDKHACALVSGGGVKCWGLNDRGQLGNDSTTNSGMPVDVAGLASGVIAISAGERQTCALTSGGGVKCWGSGFWGELGNGSNTDSRTPLDVSGLTSGVAAIAAGGEHTCAITSVGGVKCWGDNSRYGQLGNGSSTSSSTPVNVIALTSGVSTIAAGYVHTCIARSGGGVRCWGKNEYGQLGNGSTAGNGAPVDVLFAAGPTTSAWQAKVGASGANGTANVSTVTTGAGSVGLKLVKLRPSSLLPVAVYKGTCASVGARLFKLASIKTTSTGAAARTSNLTTAQVSSITTATKGTGKIAFRVGSGSSAKCGVFAKRSVLGPQAVVQAFYDWYITDHPFEPIEARRDVTPGLIKWLKAWTVPVDPIVCAQDFPVRFTAGAAATSGSSSTVRVSSELGNAAVKLTLGPTGWQISAVKCGF